MAVPWFRGEYNGPKSSSIDVVRDPALGATPDDSVGSCGHHRLRFCHFQDLDKPKEVEAAEPDEGVPNHAEWGKAFLVPDLLPKG